MKIITFLAAFAISGLDFLAASPTRAGLAEDPLLKRGIHLTWSPADAYTLQPERKAFWEGKCRRTLARKGCAAGRIHKGATKVTRNGKTTYHINVEGAPLMGMEYRKKFHVFRDGTAEDVTLGGWSDRDRKMMMKAKQPRKDTRVQEGPKAVLSWDPADAYTTSQPKKKKYWEQRCDQALIAKGCRSGILHQGEVKVIRNGEKTSYINVEGLPSLVGGDKKKDRMRVFQDGSSENGWSARDQKLMRAAKQNRKATKIHGSQDQEAHDVALSWDPVDSYEKFQGKKRLYWEERCRPALAKEGCIAGTIHRGEIKTLENGQRTSYVAVEGAPSTGAEEKKLLRVFQDGSSEHGWSHRDRRLMADAKRHSAAKHRNFLMEPMGSMDESSSPDTADQVPLQVSAQSNMKSSLMAQETRTRAFKRQKIHQTQTAGSMGPAIIPPTPTRIPTEEVYPRRFRAPGGPQLDLNFPPDWQGSEP